MIKHLIDFFRKFIKGEEVEISFVIEFELIDIIFLLVIIILFIYMLYSW